MANAGTALAKVLGSAVGDFATTTAQQAIQGVMGHNANLASARGQAAAADFNSSQTNAANQQNIASMANQYQFNSAQAQMANQFSVDQWNRAAAWNEAMWQKQADFNAEQAQIQRDWQERMSNTQYQRAMADMQKAGLNPILAYGGISGGVPSGAVANVGGAQMSSAQGVMASGGLLGAEAGSISGYQGQLEFTGGVLNLLATALGGMSSAAQAFGAMGDAGETIAKEVSNTMFGSENGKKAYDIGSATYKKWKSNVNEKGLGAGTWETVKDVGKAAYHVWKNDGSKGFNFLSNRAKG